MPQPAVSVLTPPTRAALRLAALFAAATLLFHVGANLLQARLGWGYFRDEFYYLMCGRRLAWGYVDHGPLVAVQARLSELLFGRSLAGLRLLSAVGGALRVFLTGLLTFRLGGGRAAQALAMLGVSVAPIYLILDSFLSMNSWESAFWLSSLLVVLALARGASPRLWLLFGLAAGIGFLNKASIAFFLAALLLGMLLRPERRLLRTPWLLAGMAVFVAITAPFLVWQGQHGWAMLQFLHDATKEQAASRPTALGLLLAQWIYLHPFAILLWLPGLVWLLARREWRWLGLAWLLFYTLMTAMHSKEYYPTPIAPLLFAAGGVAWSTRLGPSARDRLIGFPIFESALLAGGLLLAPVAVPVMTPAAWVAYARDLHVRGFLSDAGTPMPQYLADRFGWQEELTAVHQILASLPPAERSNVYILCSNYGEAAALEWLGHDLPPVISGHNNYFWWGPRGATGETMLVINGASLADMQQSYADVHVAGYMHNLYAMPYESRRTLWLARNRRQNLTADWAEMRHYD